MDEPLDNGSDYSHDEPPTTPLTLPSLMIGGAVFSHHYNADPSHLPTSAIIDRAFSAGANAIDTSPYYGDSESLLGRALTSLRPHHPRPSYTLITKCGRLSLTQFDYSAPHIRSSVLRSLHRLRTPYLDIVLLHDAEFVSRAEVLTGMRTLASLRAEGLIRAIGLSGYPLPALLAHARFLHENGVPAEVFFSYAHFSLTNTLLAESVADFRAAGIEHVINGSPLCLGLLRAERAPEWHPAAPALKAACVEASAVVGEKYRQRLADVALRFALGFEGTTCVGCSNLGELDTALGAWETVKARKELGEGDGGDEVIFKDLRGILVGAHEVTWPVPPVGWVREM